jgi:hypothetical protein
MSTKIFDVYKFNGSIFELQEHLIAFRAEHKEISMHLLDTYKRPFNQATEEQVKSMLTDESMMFNNRDKAGALIASIAVYIDKLTESIVLQFFVSSTISKQSILRATLLAQGKLQDYHYQDQSDPYYALEEDGPYVNGDERTKQAIEDEYKERNQLWGRVLELEDIPDQAAMTFRLTPNSNELCYPGYSLPIMDRVLSDADKHVNWPSIKASLIIMGWTHDPTGFCNQLLSPNKQASIHIYYARDNALVSNIEGIDPIEFIKMDQLLPLINKHYTN